MSPPPSFIPALSISRLISIFISSIAQQVLIIYIYFLSLSSWMCWASSPQVFRRCHHRTHLAFSLCACRMSFRMIWMLCSSRYHCLWQLYTACTCTKHNLGVQGPVWVTGLLVGLWCMSPSHRYFCTKNIDVPNLTPFLIPFTKVMHLIERRKTVRQFFKIFKTEGVINVYEPDLASLRNIVQRWHISRHILYSLPQYVLVPDDAKLYVQRI